MTAESEADVQGLAACGALVRRVFEQLKAAARPGVTTASLDAIAEREFARAGALSAPRHYYDFPGATCISVNPEAAHGIPGPRRLRDGDLVNIDVSAVLNGYVADMGESFVVGVGRQKKRAGRERIARAVRQGVWAAIEQVRPGRSLNVIGMAAQAVADRYGYQIVDNLGSHGVGRHIHEEPSYVPKPDPRERRRLLPGMVLTIEPFFTTGAPWVDEGDDGWTLMAGPDALIAQYEQTVIVREDGPLVVTAARS
ncbi:MAG: type I methionyl aminopeptidase [Pseudomonadota bacterium]